MRFGKILNYGVPDELVALWTSKNYSFGWFSKTRTQSCSQWWCSQSRLREIKYGSTNPTVLSTWSHPRQRIVLTSSLKPSLMQARPSKKPVYPSSPLPLICLKSITTAPLSNMRINLRLVWLFGTHRVNLLQLFLNKSLGLTMQWKEGQLQLPGCWNSLGRLGLIMLLWKVTHGWSTCFD